LSRLRLARGDVTSSVQFAQQALNNAPGNPLARLSLARGLIAQRQTTEAQREISGLLKQYPKAAPVHALNGALLATNKDLAGARAAYERALVLDANSLEALNGLILLDLAQKNGGRARARIEAQLKSQPDQSDLLALAARVYVTERDFASAERVLRHLVDVDEANMTGYSMLGQVYLLQRKLEPARVEFEKRIAVNAKDAPAHLMVAMIYEVQGKSGEARKKYEDILAIDSRSVIAANNLAYMLANANQNLDRALELAQTAAKQAPDNAAVQDTLGWVYYQKQLPDLAVQAFEHSVAKDPNVPEYHYHLGLAHVRAGNLVRGRRALEAALKLRPDYPDARRALQSIVG
jgi:tetratricopeptide (TPR) repeat protein